MCVARVSTREQERIAKAWQELGGQADEPRPVPDMGWFATCKDTQGNEFGLWQNDPSATAG